MLHPRLIFLATFASICLFQSFIGNAKEVFKTFVVDSRVISPLCHPVEAAVVNGSVPGPLVEVKEGDQLIVDIINESPYYMTIHWHGVHQKLTPWYDGPEMITQCPILPGTTFRNNFTLTGQEGTLWWHAHISLHRFTVYGALVIRPRDGKYPFTATPDFEVPVLLGEWWNHEVSHLEEVADRMGRAEPFVSNAFTINGHPGDLYHDCGETKNTFTLIVEHNKTYMLRIVNAAMNNQHFFQLAGHKFTVVAVDAQYTQPYETDVIVVASGQTVDALVKTVARPAKYYMAARQFFPLYGLPGVPPIDDTTTTAVVWYKGSHDKSAPILPDLIPINDPNGVGNRFYTSIKGLLLPGSPTVPQKVDVNMFITVGMGKQECKPSQIDCDPFADAASLNNVSFVSPKGMSLLEASVYNVPGVYTRDFPDNPPVIFDYTNQTEANIDPLPWPEKGTRVKHLRYGDRVEIVFQNTAIFGPDYHPMHLHGYDFFVVAQGFGNYDPDNVERNLENPQSLNTLPVPSGGWAVIRFVADNPGMWYMHCHIEHHVHPDLMMAFEVEGGRTPETTIIPPPQDLPVCEPPSKPLRGRPWRKAILEEKN